MKWRFHPLPALLVIVAVGALASLAYGQHAHHGDQDATTATPPSHRSTMQELHESGGVPRGWKFTLPKSGDAKRGREVFVSLECYKCHTIHGEPFPAAGADAKNVGPELSGMGQHHPAEYFAESIVNPNAVIVAGQGYTGPDGLSIMPSFADSITVTQLLDVVAYITSLKGNPDKDHHHASGAREIAAGPYRVRLVYSAGGQKSQQHQRDHSQGHDHAAMTAGPSHLMAFVVDRDSSDPVPYLPVTATLQITGKPPRTIRLMPMTSGHGFHYGADATVPDETQRITITIGATTMMVAGPGATAYKKPAIAVFEWSPPAK
ncbi:MAG: hypothetical protein DMD91_16270 [Candidatus Rokuibacteriota bacterium]|nr:MAG: hypothetical protein DMD91_16270 [Candidatus Rokubacteria bacterium]